MYDLRTLDELTAWPCHSERSEESPRETLHFVQVDNSCVPSS